MANRKEDVSVKGYFRGGRMVRSHRKKVEKGEEQQGFLSRNKGKLLAGAGVLGTAALGAGALALRARGAKAALAKQNAAQLQALGDKVNTLVDRTSALRTNVTSKAAKAVQEGVDNAPPMQAISASLDKLQKSVNRIDKKVKALDSAADLSPGAVSGRLGKIKKAQSLTSARAKGAPEKLAGLSEDTLNSIEDKVGTARKNLQQAQSKTKQISNSGGAGQKIGNVDDDLEEINKRLKSIKQKAQGVDEIDQSRLGKIKKPTVGMGGTATTQAGGASDDAIASLRKEIDELKARGVGGGGATPKVEAKKKLAIKELPPLPEGNIYDGLTKKESNALSELADSLDEAGLQKQLDDIDEEISSFSPIDRLLGKTKVANSKLADYDKLAKKRTGIYPDSYDAGEIERLKTSVDEIRKLRKDLGLETPDEFGMEIDVDIPFGEKVNYQNNYLFDYSNMSDNKGKLKLQPFEKTILEPDVPDNYLNRLNKHKKRLRERRDIFSNRLKQIEELRTAQATPQELDTSRMADLLDDFSQGRAFGEVYFSSDIEEVTNYSNFRQGKPFIKVVGFNRGVSSHRQQALFSSRAKLATLAEFGLFGLRKPKEERRDYTKDAIGTAAALGSMYLAYRKYNNNKNQSNNNSPSPRIVSNNNTMGSNSSNTGGVSPSANNSNISNVSSNNNVNKRKKKLGSRGVQQNKGLRPRTVGIQKEPTT